jgi:dienelactone hydrolase/Tol biopolymer transport system component
MRRLVYLTLVLFLAHVTFAQPGDDTHGITLERIMADPDWIGLFPERSFWSDQGDSVLFFRDRAGESTEDLVELDLTSQEERIVSLSERNSKARTSWVHNSDRSSRLCVRGGDLYLHNLESNVTTQLTRTSSRESSAIFLSDDSEVGYVEGGNWFVLNLQDASIREVADIRFEDEPKDDEEDGTGYLDRQQERLFSVISDQQSKQKAKKKLSDDIRDANESAVTGPFFLGKKYQRRRFALSDDGRYIAIVISEAWDDAERDSMPAYVTEDGYVESSNVRHKVGVRQGPSEFLYLLDTELETSTKVDLSELPGIKDDPLAFLKEMESHEDSDDTQIDAKKEKDELEARPVSIGSLHFRPGADKLVIMVSSHDHKDRWLASVEMAGDELPVVQTIHRDTTEAWINWRTFRSGWIRDGSAYWFLSEASGYSHLYAWDGSSVRQITNGEYEIWDVVQSHEPGVLLARTNKPDPSVFEIAQISLADDSIKLLTDFGKVVERFRLAPDGHKLLLEVSSNDHPAELFVQRLANDAEPVQLTRSLSKGFERIPWIKPEYVDVPCRDGRSIRARVYKSDSDGSKQSLSPGVIFVHGAGYTQNIHRGWPYYFREMMFHSMLAYKGYVVVDIDYRASAGYGRDFREAIYRNMGGPELEDMVDTAKWMTAEHGVASDRIGTYGGSYGGFLAIMAVFKEPDVFNAAAALRPVTDWAHYNHGYTSAILNTPEIDPDAYERSSPIEHAEGFRGGLLICHGMLDDNVLVQDTIRLQQRLIELEKQDWEVALYPMEAHGFIEPTAWLDEYRRVFKLFETRLNTADR